jgi:hypothetical protein
MGRFIPEQAPLEGQQAETGVVGPRLSDADFFGQALDTSRPGLEEIPAAVARGDFGAARRLFAAEARRSLQPARLLAIARRFGGDNVLHPGERAGDAAERILRLELISCGTPHQFAGEVDWFANPTFNQYREWTWQLSRHSEWGLLAERYRETGDERYAEGFVKLFRSWVRQAVVPEDAPGGATLCWRTIEAGIRMGGAWPWALHSFYRSPHFTDDVLVDWYKSVWEHGRRLRQFHRTHNWLIMEMNGLAQIGILYPQFREAPAWKAYAFDRLVEELGTQIYPDGFQFELTTNYHQVVIGNYEWLWDVCDAYDEPVPDAFRAGLEPMHAVNVRLMMPDGRLPDLNDGRWAEVAPLLRRAVARYPERADFRWAASRGAEGAPPAETSLAFPYAGYYVMRSGWGPDAVWALFDGGPFGFAHQHEDKLNLLLHAHGRLLLTEGGNYAYDSSEMRRYVLSTRAHNTIRVDGQDQNRRLRFDREDTGIIATPARARWRAGDHQDVAEADYDEGYGPAAERTVTHRRRVLFLKGGAGAPGPCFLVVDRLLPADGAPHTYQVLWHLNAASAEADGLVVRSRNPDAPNLAIMPAGVAGLRAAVVAGQEAPEWQGWRATKNNAQGPYEPAPTAVYEWTVTGPARLVTLLYPTPAGADCPVRALTAAPDPAASAVRLTLTDGGAIGLDEADLGP